jgi:NAD(P)-dependent dehydrogenase (short-subunit alcohol dehydrogenase family)
MEKGAAIVFTSSTAAVLPSTTDIPAYAASKAALAGLNVYVAKEAAPKGVRINMVTPGLIDTSLGRLATRIRPDRAQTPIPLSRQGTAWEVAYATVFLLSHEASYITGQSIVVDGGLSAIR